MKLRLLVIEGKVPGWLAAGRAEYVQKISGFIPMELRGLKSPPSERDQAEVKRRREGQMLLEEIDDRDLLVLFDVRGRAAKSSEEFALALGRAVESGKSRLVFAVGGAYGFSDEIYQRANMKWSLSALTMNHWLAQLTALEQIYRGLTILKGIPYHNR